MFCISVLVGCWLLAGVVQLVGIGMYHLFISWRLNLRSVMVSFSTKKVFSSGAVAVCVAPVVTTVAECIHIRYVRI